MSWTDLPTNYTDATFTGLRKYSPVTNEDGTVSFIDMTVYQNRENSFFGAKDANQMNGAINKLMANNRGAVNLLDNSDFRNPVNQRGGTSWLVTSGTVAEGVVKLSANGYMLDRWMLNKGAAELTTNGLKLTAATLRQAVSLRAGIYTFVVYLDNGITLTRVFQYDGASEISSLGGNNTTESAYVGVYHHKTGVPAVQFVQSEGSSIEYTVVHTALYEGEYTADNLPAYQPKGYGAELYECMRYYRAYSKETRFVGYISAGSKGFYFTLDRPMRVTPTVINSAKFIIRTVSGYSSAAPYDNPTSPKTTVANGLSAPYIDLMWDTALGTNNTPVVAEIYSGSLEFSADL